MRTQQLICASIVLTVCCFLSSASAQSFSFAAIGDVPYGPLSELTLVTDTLNKNKLAFTIHVGDIKSGSSVCSDEIYLAVREQFERFTQALIYTPGDNEWTDCHRTSNGGYDPLERLEKIRGIFFANKNSFGKKPLAMQLQSDDARFALFIENRRWHQHKFSFATLHIVGSNNNLQIDLPSSIEFNLRNEANIAWMRETFAQAQKRGDLGVVFAMQADTFYAGGKEADSTGFKSWLTAFQEEIVRWNKPVLLIQGDTHVLQIDHPMTTADGARVDQLTRVVVQGGLQKKLVIVDVRADQPRDPFVIRQIPVSAGR